MNAKLTLRRLRKWRTDRVLRWVKPSHNHYFVTVWRRVNPRYKVQYNGVDENINQFQFVDIHYTRWHFIAIIYQGILGREKWTDGFKQQVVIISPPGSEYLIPPRDVTFDDYPTPKRSDLIPDVDE